ncbi:MAG: PucR family transcriptional regulator ligand-binding domain-containing protein [Thermaerobacter sp.]|nr:PucR family transcriptional regulator ligand-binding domain-containing protein [Thermaerobacter sp.]
MSALWESRVDGVEAVTVAAILGRPLFADAQIVAGASGISRPIRWVHVGEVPDVSAYLEGNELILTTGIGLSTREARAQYLRGLAHVAGIILECGRYLPEPPDDMIDLADGLGVPLIVFCRPVRFLDLSQDVIPLLLNQRHQTLANLEPLARGLRHALLNTLGFEAIVDQLSRATELSAAFFSPWLRPAGSIPPDTADWLTHQPPLSAMGRERLPFAPHLALARQTVYAGRERAGELLLWLPADARVWDEWLVLAMDRTATALAQEWLRTQPERKRREHRETWMAEQLLYANHPLSRTADDVLHELGLDSTQLAAWVIAVEPHSPLSAAEWQLARQACHSILLQEGRQAVGLAKGNRHLWAIISPRAHPAAPNWLRLLRDVATRFACRVGISDTIADPSRFSEARRQAMDVLTVAGLLAVTGDDSAWIFTYGSVGLYRLLLRTPRDVLQSSLIDYELKPLLAYDTLHRTDLTGTLRVLLTYSESRAKAAEVLYIHRQTLYHRLRLLSRLLGPDFLSPTRRLSLQVALAAHQYLNALGERAPSALPLPDTARDG